MLERIIPAIGIIAMVALCLGLSANRGAALRRWQLIAWGLGLQFVLALLILRTAPGAALFAWLNDAFVAVIDSTKAGVEFVFGTELTNPSMGAYFAFVVLPIIIFFSSLTAILYHLQVLQRVVQAFSWIMRKTMKTSGAETLCASANIFVSQTEAPLMVRPYLGRMTKSELMTVMTGGFATVAGSVLAAYVGFLRESTPGIAGHLMAASVMSAPAALLFGKLLIPETEVPETANSDAKGTGSHHDNVLDAAAAGASEGVKLALNVGGMIIAFLSLLALLNLIVGWGWSWIPAALTTDGPLPAEMTIEALLGFLFAPLAWLIGIPWEEAAVGGRLLGLKIATNEFVAFIEMGADPEALSVRSRIIMSYALAGFANVGSIGIQLGGLSLMAPERRADLARLAIPALFAGFLAANTTAAVAALLIVDFDEPPVAAQVVEEALEDDLDDDLLDPATEP